MRLKSLLTLVILCLALSAKAQVYVGGNIGLAVSGADNRVGINISPEAGYHFNRYFTAGGSISYQSLYNTFGITPYVRGNFGYIQDRVHFFVALTAPMRFAADYQSYSGYLRPGISVRVAEGVWIMAHIGAFGYSYVRSGDQSAKGWVAKVDANTVNIGFCFNLGI